MVYSAANFQQSNTYPTDKKVRKLFEVPTYIQSTQISRTSLRYMLIRSSYLRRKLPNELSPSNFECSLSSRQSYPYLSDNASSLTSGEEY